MEPDLRLRAPAATSVAAHGAAPVAISVAVGPELRLDTTNATPATAAGGSNKTGSTSGKRVKFASPPLQPFCEVLLLQRLFVDEILPQIRSSEACLWCSIR